MPPMAIMRIWSRQRKKAENGGYISSGGFDGSLGLDNASQKGEEEAHLD